MPEYLTTVEAAAYLKRSRESIYRLARKGIIGKKPFGRHNSPWYFTREELDNLMRRDNG